MTTIVAVDEAWTEPPRMRLTVTAAGVVGADLVVLRVHEDGSRHRVLVEDRPRVIAGSWVGYDFHSPYNVPVRYVAQVTGQVESAPSAARELPSRLHWLIDPVDPARSVPVDALRALGDPAQESRATSLPIIGSPRPLVISDGYRPSEVGSFTVRVDSPQSRAALTALLAQDGPVLINRWSVDRWEAAWQWVQPGNLAWVNPGGWTAFPFRIASFGTVAVDQPDVAFGALWTCADVLDTFASCSALLAAYATCNGLKTDTRGA